jgi:hypothetical protein
MGNYAGMLLAHAMKFVAGTPGNTFLLANTDYPASGSYADVSKTERFHVVARMGDINASDVPVIEVKQTTSASGTLTTISTTYAKRTLSTANADQFVVFTIETKKLTEDNFYVSAVVSGATNGSYGEIFLLLPETSIPVTQTTTLLPAASQLNFTG